MKITDRELLKQAIEKPAITNYLHKETKIILSDILKAMPNDTITFKEKGITNHILEAWTWILQDSVYNLKRCDLREDAHWTTKANYRQQKRNLNQQYVFGLDRILRYFKDFTEFERVLYGIDGGYRDHVVHVFRVWLLGIVILYWPNGMTVQDIEVQDILEDKQVFSEEEIISMWAIIALCHDLGYPLEMAEKINDSVERMYRNLGNMNIQRFSAAFKNEHQYLDEFLLDVISSKLRPRKNDESYEEILNLYDSISQATKLNDEIRRVMMNTPMFFTAKQSKYRAKFANSLKQYSHGIISSSILLKSLFFFLESDFSLQENNLLSFEDGRQFLIRREILRSIAAHTCPEIYHLQTNTLSFLLILCDELQEWGRPRFSDMHNNTKPATEVSINDVSRQNIEFELRYSVANDEEDALARSAFSRWHTILRSAVEDDKRKFKMEIKLDINDKVFKFKFVNNILSTTKGDGKRGVDFPVYEDLFKKIFDA